VVRGRGSKEDAVRFFSVISCERIREGNKLKNSIFGLNIRIMFFIVRVFKSWKMLPAEIAQFPSLEIFKT